MSANTSCRQRSPPGYEHEVTIQIYRLALANPTAVSRGSRRWPKFINFYKNVTIESRTLRDFEHRLAPPPQGPGPRDPGAKLARTPGPQRQIGPDPGPWPRPGPRTTRRFWAFGALTTSARGCEGCAFVCFYIRLDSRKSLPKNFKKIISQGRD